MEEEIKIYRSAWKNVLLSLCNFAFVVISVLILFSENKKPGFDIVAWIGILFFGLGGLLIAYDIFKGQVTRTPFLIITDKKVTINSWRSWGGVSFADVETFFLISHSTAKMIGIKYKKDIEAQRLDNANQLGRAIRNINVKLAGAQDAIATGGLTVEPQALCDLLNERLEDFNRNT